MNRKKIINTNNKEIYQKFNMLNFSSEIVLNKIKNIQIEKILRNINKEENILDMKIIDNYIIIKKIKPLNFKIYMKEPKHSNQKQIYI